MVGLLVLVLLVQTCSANEGGSDKRNALSPLHLFSLDSDINRYGSRLFEALSNREQTDLPPLSEFDVLPWACDCEHYWRDLGQGHFPRYVRDARCRHSTCWFGHFDCIPQKYEINVLKQLEPSDLLNPDFRYQVFEEEFILTPLNVTVSCFCGR